MNNSAMYRVVRLAAAGEVSLPWLVQIQAMTHGYPVITLANELGNALPTAAPAERLYG